MRVSQSELNKDRERRRGGRLLEEIGVVDTKREDGYTNVLNKYGTSQDNSEAYKFEREPTVPDLQLTALYEGNGLFATIIDTPAEEALKHGFDLNLNNAEVGAYLEESLDDIEWEEKAAAAIKWARLYGGAIIVMLIDDGKGLEEPVDWEHIKSIDELRVYERAVVEPDYMSLYLQDTGKSKYKRSSKFGEPEFFYVSSIYGSFKVHESRCLVFRNGVLPEQTTNSTYRYWGMPEYVRIRRALRETTTAHTDATKLLERSVQAVYSIKNLSALLATDDGENQVLKRLEIIDMARNFLNSVAIDSDGESYDFKTFQFSGVKDVIDSTCNMLSALTHIPQTLLFGRSPSGMNATGISDLENYYNFVERIQKLMLKKNLRYLVDVIFRAGIVGGNLKEEPDYKLSFNPLWSLSDTEQASVEQTRAATAYTKAQTAQIYVDMQAIDPSEVRKKLASDEDFDVEDIVEEDDDLYNAVFGEQMGVAESDIEAAKRNVEQLEAPGGIEQAVPNADADDDTKWITINGTHTPLGENGEATGGPLKGESFSAAKSEPSGGGGAESKTSSGESSKNDLPNSGEGAIIENEESELKSSTAVSATGANTFKVGFTGKNLNKHWGGKSDHSAQYPNMTKEQYAKRALNLVQSPTSATIKGYRTPKGEVVRYDTETGDFVKGLPDTGIKTMFKPDNPDEYYERHKRHDKGVDND